jgi:hypothetical protein
MLPIRGQSFEEIASGKRRARKPVGLKIKRAIELMTSGGPDGRPRELVDAAREVGMFPSSLRRSLQRPEVRAFQAEQYDAAILAMSTVVPARLHALMLQDDNRVAATNAVRLAHGMMREVQHPDHHARSRQQSVPGLVVIVGSASAPAALSAPVVDVSVQRVEPLAVEQSERIDRVNFGDNDDAA